MSVGRRTVEDHLPLERMPLACTLGSPLDPHVRQSLGLQGLVDLDHQRVKFLIAHQQRLSMIVHDVTAHPGAVWLVQSEPDLRIAGPGHSGQLGIDCPQPGSPSPTGRGVCAYAQPLPLPRPCDAVCRDRTRDSCQNASASGRRPWACRHLRVRNLWKFRIRMRGSRAQALTTLSRVSASPELSPLMLSPGVTHIRAERQCFSCGHSFHHSSHVHAPCPYFLTARTSRVA